MNANQRQLGTTVATLAFALAVVTATAQAELIHHWRLDEDTGATGVAVDSAGGLDGTIMGASSAEGARPGTNGGFSFDGEMNIVSFSGFTAPQQGTLAFWINAALPGGRERVLGAGNEYESFVEGNGEIKNELFDGGGGTLGTGAGGLTTDEWAHIALTYDYDAAGPSRHGQIYVNGELAAEGPATEPSAPTGATFLLGHRFDGPATQHFEGLLDDVQLYSRVLDASQVMLLFQNPGAVVPEPGLPGDVNGDELVNRDDLDVIRSNFLESVLAREEGDLTGDGLVGFEDFREWKDNSMAGFAAPAAVPEPGSRILLILSAVGLFIRSRRGC